MRRKMLRAAIICWAIALVAILQACGPTPLYPDVQIVRGMWAPGMICYDGTEEVLRHEELHEYYYRQGKTMAENKRLVDGLEEKK